MTYVEATLIAEMFLCTTDAFGITSNEENESNFVCDCALTDVFYKIGVIKHVEE